MKSAKHHLRRVTNGHALTFEELSTVTAEIEACLNSRPMYAISDASTDCQAITPADVLGTGPTITPIVDQADLATTHPTRRWAFLQWMVADFWRQWRSEYLASLQRTNKWAQASRNIKPGDIVVVINDNLPRAHWQLGKIVAVAPGRDGRVRNVTVQASAGELDRPIQKLVLLPIDAQAETTSEPAIEPTS